MARIRIIEAQAIDWQPVAAAVPPDVAARMSRAEREADVRILHSGQNGQAQLFEARIAADEIVSLHAHAADEIIYILDGELRMGRKRLGPGSSAYICGNTLYGFSAGADGVRFLNFRAAANTPFITRDEFMAAQKKAR